MKPQKRQRRDNGDGDKRARALNASLQKSQRVLNRKFIACKARSAKQKKAMVVSRDLIRRQTRRLALYRKSSIRAHSIYLISKLSQDGVQCSPSEISALRNVCEKADEHIRNYECAQNAAGTQKANTLRSKQDRDLRSITKTISQLSQRYELSWNLAFATVSNRNLFVNQCSVFMV